MKEFYLAARAFDARHTDKTQVFRSRVFAPNYVVAKSRFFMMLKKQHKVKRANTQLIACSTIVEKNPAVVKNFQVFLRYQSANGVHNITKQYRDVTRVGAVRQMYADLASQYKATKDKIQLISITTVPDSKVHNPVLKQFLGAHVKFPVLHRKPCLPCKRYAPVFARGKLSTRIY